MLLINKILTNKARLKVEYIDYRLVKFGRGNPLFDCCVGNPLGLGNPLPIGRLICGFGIAPLEIFLTFNSSFC